MDGDFQNDEVIISSAGTAVEFVIGSGTDISTKRYLPMQGRTHVTKLVIRTSKAIQITEINYKTPKVGIPVQADKSFTISDSMKISQFKILTGEATTDLHVFVA